MENKKTPYTKPELREQIKNRIMNSDRGGKPGQWSARKSQLLAKEYEDAGGGYRGKKTESQKSLSRWSKEKWMTKDEYEKRAKAKRAAGRYKEQGNG